MTEDEKSGGWGAAQMAFYHRAKDHGRTPTPALYKDDDYLYFSPAARQIADDIGFGDRIERCDQPSSCIVLFENAADR